jgi:spore coat polysaccharide biosynthesis protein SpsF
MTDERFSTEQEAFWAGPFGSAYVERNRDAQLIGSATYRFARILANIGPIRSAIEFGANIGLNLRALRALLPTIDLCAVEINPDAHRELTTLPQLDARLASLLEFEPTRTYDLAFTSAVLIHISPSALPRAYDRLYRSSHRYIVIQEYFSTNPAEIVYRGHSQKLFKRDFAGELLDRFSDLKLRDYGFFYRRDLNFSSDDLNWFVLEKSG